jgi:hypothetical protein
VYTREVPQLVGRLNNSARASTPGADTDLPFASVSSTKEDADAEVFPATSLEK